MVSILSLLPIPLAVTAAAVPQDSSHEARQQNDCQIDRVGGNTWHKDGMSRRRVNFSSMGTSATAHCGNWEACVPYPNVANNLQCWGTNDDDTAGSLDVSFALGLAGDRMFENCFRETFDQWRRDTHCKTG